MIYKRESSLDASQFLAEQIKTKIASNQKVLWLLSGGSGGKVCLKVAELLDGKNLGGLTAVMGDERYGRPGHSDDNLDQLLKSGFTLPRTEIHQVLNSKNRQETARDFETWLIERVEQADFVIGITGIGTDGHTIGIKPHSPAVNSSRLVEDYAWDDFERITITPKFVWEYVDLMVVQAYGEEKWPVIEKLLGGEGEIDDFPASLFRDLDDAVLYSDFDEQGGMK